ncbi:MAG TPA: M20 family metallopeptidase [Clostridiales bacterium]|nr:M20 family metallopeptidase [Clostridiales bacterium]
MEKYLDESINFLEKLVSFKSIKDEPVDGGPFGLENKKALEYALSMFEYIGAKTKNLDGFVGYADFFPDEYNSEEIFGILIHLDVVPVDNNWNTDPFTLTEKDGKLFGRGTIDDKGPLSAIYIAFKKLLDEGLKIKNPVRFILGCDEESGWGCINHYKKHEKFPVFGIAPDASFPVINYEKGILNFKIAIPKPEEIIKIEGGDRSNIVAPKCSAILKNKLGLSLYYKKLDNHYLYEIKGKSAHASTPDLGINAIVKMLLYLSHKHIELKPILDLIAAFQYITNNEYEKSDYFDVKLTNNLGKVSSDDNNIYFTFDIRYPKEISPNEILSVAKNKGDVLEDSIVIKEPLFVDPDNFLVKSLLTAYEKVTNKKGEPLAIGGGTYARALPLAVSFGPNFEGDEEVAHMANEYITIENLERCIEIYYLALKEILF